ncbi:hypothetical protein RIVM261_018550 [Rivularia sp. IAM M-261]|nr:hypothetical protein CAL7716_028830 [Calothrix sp. PCC 7716]GJD16899.1 hypothetical protein RIVM261_018550 [Rivularia sp. IAM M-261]
MSSITNQLINSPIERWVQAVEFVDSVNTSNSTNKPLLLDVSDFFELVDRSQLAKRSKPSYKWQIDKQERWYRIWFNESNLTIQIDLYFSNDEYQMNMYEIDLETCTTALSIIKWLYHAILGKKWVFPRNSLGSYGNYR